MARPTGKRVDNERRVTRGSEDAADWTSINPRAMAEAIGMVASRGGALRFGYTRDGGAYALGIYGDGEPYTEFFKPSDNIEEYLIGLIDAWR